MRFAFAAQFNPPLRIVGNDLKCRSVKLYLFLRAIRESPLRLVRCFKHTVGTFLACRLGCASKLRLEVSTGDPHPSRLSVFSTAQGIMDSKIVGDAVLACRLGCASKPRLEVSTGHPHPQRPAGEHSSPLRGLCTAVGLCKTRILHKDFRGGCVFCAYCGQEVHSYV